MANRPTGVNDAAEQLGVSAKTIKTMVAVGQIAQESKVPPAEPLLVMVRANPKGQPRYAPAAPFIRDTFDAASVAISRTTPGALAKKALGALSEIGFLIRDSHETHITPTAKLTVNTVPEIRDRIEQAVGGNRRVRAHITAYSSRGCGQLVPDPL
jgi:hypothetical protein